MSFSLGSVAVQGLPPGQYVLRIEDIEAGISGTKNDKITFKAVVVHSDNPDVKAGQKEIWSYTYAKQYISIVATDLVRAGLPKDLQLSGIASQDAVLFAQYMRGHHYIVNVVVQKKDPTKTNTNFVQEYNAAGLPTQQAPASVAAAPVAALAPLPFAPTPQPAQQQAWGTPPQGAAGGPVAPAPAQVGPPGWGAQAPAAAPFINPAQQAPIPQAQAQQSAPQVEEAPLNPDLIQRLQAGQRPPLNSKQLAQIKQVGWTAIYEEYEALARAQQSQPQAAVPQAQDPAQSLLAAYNAV
jgi:hypothetical protein